MHESTHTTASSIPFVPSQSPTCHRNMTSADTCFRRRCPSYKTFCLQPRKVSPRTGGASVAATYLRLPVSKRHTMGSPMLFTLHKSKDHRALFQQMQHASLHGSTYTQGYENLTLRLFRAHFGTTRHLCVLTTHHRNTVAKTECSCSRPIINSTVPILVHRFALMHTEPYPY